MFKCPKDLPAVKKDDIVTFTYTNLSEHQPVDAMLERVRNDITWKEFLENAKPTKKESAEEIVSTPTLRPDFLLVASTHFPSLIGVLGQTCKQ